MGAVPVLCRNAPPKGRRPKRAVAIRKAVEGSWQNGSDRLLSVIKVARVDSWWYRV